MEKKTSPPLLSALNFSLVWRDYQQRFLAHFKEHITDNHLHVVAPPGSGKTILGLEMLLRIGEPTLVLAPTLTIRNQWKNRLITFFNQNREYSGISLDIKKPNLLTFSTYQSLFSLHKSFGEAADQQLLAYVNQHNIKTLVLDEAHHLKNGWWKSLFALKAIPNLTIIALTATPPYDSSAHEIERYFKLCGPIDDEIAVPDLIKNGDLCPHQDYIYFSRPQESEIRYIVAYREKIMVFLNGILEHRGFIEFIKNMPMFIDPQNHLEEIYKDPAFFSAILIYLKDAGEVIHEAKLELLGFGKDDVSFPSFGYEWAEVLLQKIVVDDRESFATRETLLEPIEKNLRAIGVLEKNRINFIGDANLYRNLASSPSKFESIYAILDEASTSLQSDLKAVVLTDFIRKEYLTFKGKDTSGLSKIGVVSIFQYLLAKSQLGHQCAVLTGSLVILPNAAITYFKQCLGNEGLKLDGVVSSEAHQSIRVRSGIKNKMVAAVTKLFEEGKIRILIGTKSLLGEGWDAPSINTLVLASCVGSFVSSNQMRGRAIRIDPNTKQKVGAIWHLVCLDPTVKDGGRDYAMMKQRFQAFTGVSLQGKPYIENGISRMQLPEKWDDVSDVSNMNNNMLYIAKAHYNLRQRWQTAIANGEYLVQELRVPFARETSFGKRNRLNAVNIVKYLLVQIIAGIGLFLPEAMVKNWTVLLRKGWLGMVYIILAGIFLGFGPATFKALKTYFLFGNQFKRSRKIASVLFNYLKASGQFTSVDTITGIVANQKTNGTYSIYLDGANQHDGSLFISYLETIIAPIDNPRYLITVTSFFKRFLGYRNYYPVPQEIGRNKKEASTFFKLWQQEIGGSKLWFTRTVGGRKLLLKARFSHVRYLFEEKPEKTNAWK
ncbi:ATP-dependent helicase [Croceitalea dokdonensis DOKDO 023]|uniref:ATP-dependent helicase n=1 Tax=Croceitalea dokdonensis DOKDO 023 TaxID=1300341 RepID=A0A0P7A3P4_9FLAO|nr:DEAD/DEAH box helicase family protein [Croceitalea dokdonensis]KPM31077.1 ATP-dependent helicase [Croceitalea dokdonensis DOKDO 023]